MSENAPSLHVEFYSEAVENKAKSAVEGRPIYEDREFVKIKFPGDPKRVHVAPANEGYRRDQETNAWISYREDFPKHYERFKAGMEQMAEGTPISELPFLTEAKRKELRALNILTAEQLAGLDGSFLSRLGMGGRALKDQATAYLSHARDTALESRLAGENAELRDQIALMQRQIAELAQARPAVKTAPVKAELAEDDENPASPFADWQDEDIKAFLADRTGARPRGNPSHATLVRMADEVVASETKEEEAA